jgi:O-antigen/teichoic acid export membrane protein
LDVPTTKPKSLQARIVAGSVVLLSGSSLATGINLAYNVAVARFLGPQGYGHAAAVYTLLTLVSALTLSFQIISAKIIAQQSVEENKAAVYRDLHRGAWACGILVALLLLVFQRAIAGYLNLPSALLVVFLAVGAAFYIPLGTRRGFIQGAYGFRKLAANLVLEGAVRLGGSLLMVLLGYGVRGVIAANAAAMAVSYFAIAPRLAVKVVNPIRFAYVSREIGQAVVFFSGQVLINNCDIVLVKHFFLSKEAGMYAAIAMVGRVIFAFSSAVVNSMLPVVAGTRDEDRKNLSLIATSLLLVVSIGSVLALALRFTPAWVWTIFFGAGFQLPGHFGFPYLLALYAITTVIYSLSVVIITYEMAYKIANTSWLQLVFSGLVIAGICKFHGSLQQVIMVQLILMAFMLAMVGIPFLVIARRNRLKMGAGVSHSLRLVRRVSEDEVIAEFLKGDFEHVAYRDHHEPLREIVFAPDLTDPGESITRRAMLFLRHRSLWKELPAGTEWFEAEIGMADLDRIRVFPRAQWRKIARNDFAITEIIDRIERIQKKRGARGPFSKKIEEIRGRISQDNAMPGSVLLIGLNEKEPLTILDGNHRFVAAILEGKVDRLRFLCGLSPKMTRCCWYKTNFFTLARYAINLLSHLLFYSRSARNDFSNVPGTSRADIIPNEAAEAWWLQQAPRSEGQQLYETQNAYRESA